MNAFFYCITTCNLSLEKFAESLLIVSYFVVRTDANDLPLTSHSHFIQGWLRSRWLFTLPLASSRNHVAFSKRQNLICLPHLLAAVVHALSDKHCSSDSIATRFIQHADDILCRTIPRIACRHLGSIVVISVINHATSEDCHQPIYNLSVISNLLERFVAKQLVGYLTASALEWPRIPSLGLWHSLFWLTIFEQPAWPTSILTTQHCLRYWTK